MCSKRYSKKIVKLSIEENLFNEFKMKCGKLGKTMTQEIEEFMRNFASVQFFYVQIKKKTESGQVFWRTKIVPKEELISHTEGESCNVFVVRNGNLVELSEQEIIKCVQS